MARVLNAARAAGVLAIDGPFGAFQDLEGLRVSARLARSLGFDGKWAVHPGQIEVINEIFTPPAAEVSRARGLIEAYRQAAAEGRGAARHEGEMIDLASVRMAEGVLRRHEQITGRP
jgi:citrate lyase subunit beta/citryl-CoA lyase